MGYSVEWTGRLFFVDGLTDLFLGACFSSGILQVVIHQIARNEMLQSIYQMTGKNDWNIFIAILGVCVLFVLTLKIHIVQWETKERKKDIISMIGK